MACAEGASEKFRVFCMTAADGVTFCKFQGGGGQVPPPPAGAHAYKMRTRLKCVRIKLHEVMTACPHSWKGCYVTFAVTPNHPQLLLNEWGGVIDKREGTSKKWQKKTPNIICSYTITWVPWWSCCCLLPLNWSLVPNLGKVIRPSSSQSEKS